MPLPVAHGIIGASVVAASGGASGSSRDFKPLLLGALLAILPDLDFLLFWLLGLNSNIHRSFTHSILFAAAMGLLIASLAQRQRLKSFIVYGLATLSHALLDALTTSVSSGVELLWPMTTKRFKAGLLPYIEENWMNKTFDEFLVDLLIVSLIELVIFSPFLVSIIWMYSKVDRKTTILVEDSLQD